MIHPAGETDAGTLSLSNGRDNRPGTTDSRPGEPPSSPNPLFPPVGDGQLEFRHAFENSDLPKASRSLISERHLANSG